MSFSRRLCCLCTGVFDFVCLSVFSWSRQVLFGEFIWFSAIISKDFEVCQSYLAVFKWIYGPFSGVMEYFQWIPMDHHGPLARASKILWPNDNAYCLHC